jgi:signal transduction histidine kinase
VGVIAILLLVQAVTATNWLEFGWKFIIFLVFLYFGYLLIKSVILEIQRRQEIEKIDKAKSEFISIASHQLRTPLTAVKGYISMILDGTYGQLAEKQAKPLENVYQSNERLIRLVNDLLNLSRLDAGKIEFSPELISLEEMVSDIIEELRINAEKKGLYIKMVKPQEPLPKIMVDQDKLRQVILNIVDNAIKYTKEGGVTFELKKLDEQEEIKVSDTGEGMDEKELNSLFQMFSRATAGTQLHAEGAGLGLYVARQFIEMHEGKIWAESPGKSRGSTFYIQLPIHLSLKLLKSKTRTIINKQKHFI